jgi:hypothetical protein
MAPMTVAPPWYDATWPWMIKLARAKKHIDDLSAEAEDFQERTSQVFPEPGPNPGDIALRLRVAEPVPAHLSAVAGDVLYNVRSALDAAAYELARRHCPALESDEKLQRLSEFPFVLKENELRDWFARRQTIFGPAEEAALRAVAPGWMWDSITDADKAAEIWGTREEEVQRGQLWKLNRLCNIDKHRRLHVVALWPDIIYWTSNDADDYGWIPGSPPYADGTIVGTLIAKPGRVGPQPHIVANFELRLVDEDIVYGSAIAEGLDGLLQFVLNSTLPRLFQVYGYSIARSASAG